VVRLFEGDFFGCISDVAQEASIFTSISLRTHTLTKLSELYLGDTPVTDAGVNKLKQALPGLTTTPVVR
jgi:hypothetical protein